MSSHASLENEWTLNKAHHARAISLPINYGHYP